MELNLRHHGKVTLKIVSLKGDGVYATPRHLVGLIRFTLDDLPLNEQLRIIRLNCDSGKILRVWNSIHQQRTGHRQQAVRLLKTLPELGSTFERLLTDEKWLPASDKDSVRSQ